MEISRRTAGLGLLVYGVGTAGAFLGIDAPGGMYEEATVRNYLSSGHWALAMVLAYVGAFASLGLLAFGARMRHEVRSGGDLVWGLSVGAAVAGVVGWFLVGGMSVSFAEGGDQVARLPHSVVYLVSEMSDLIAVCAGAFLLGIATLVIAARSSLPRGLRITTYVAGVCGVLAAGFFTLFAFWLWTIGFGAWTMLRDPVAHPEPVAVGG